MTENKNIEFACVQEVQIFILGPEVGCIVIGFYCFYRNLQDISDVVGL